MAGVADTPGRGVAPSGSLQPHRISDNCTYAEVRFSESAGARLNGVSRSIVKLTMCRNIRPLFNLEPPVTEEEIRDASLQFVRKISGFHKPSKANEPAFLAAIEEVAAVSARLLLSLETAATPKNREEEVAKAKVRSGERFRR